MYVYFPIIRLKDIVFFTRIHKENPQSCACGGRKDAGATPSHSSRGALSSLILLFL